MASIASLLNPEPEPLQPSHKLPTPCSSRSARDCRTPPPRQKKQKISKDAAIFTRGRIRGQLRYPPCEYQNQELADAHKVLQIHPMGHITEFPRHIPYNSEKKSFLEKTGRESFEVLQYTFKIPGDEKTYTVMWDYNIGLVRTTSLFRCNNYSKTAPAKMLNANPGLRDICHSITGGALAAQGYWMPFEAAKAVAATFCWKIRYALTPLFGVQFLSICLPPDDLRYGRMIIDAAIVQAATITANQYRAQEINKSRLARMPRIPGDNITYSPITPKPEQQTNTKSLRPKPTSSMAMEELDSEIGTDTDTSEQYRNSPSLLPNSGWTPANTPRRSAQGTRHATISNPPSYRPPLPSPRDILASLSRLQNQSRTNYDSDQDEDEEHDPNPPLSDNNEPGTDLDGASLSDSSIQNTPYDGPTTTDKAAGADRTNSPLPLTNDARAAYMLMKLHMQEVICNDEDQTRKRRRASA